MTTRRCLARTTTVAGLSLALVVPALSSASADPKRGDVFPLTCGGTTYDVIVTANGEFTPAHDRNSNLVFIPHAFTAIHGELRDASGTLVDSFDEPASTQGSGRQRNDVSCTFRITGVSDGSDPEGPPAGYTSEIVGGVTGQVAGHA